MSAARPTSATVTLHRALYAADAITDAAATFGDFAAFAVHPQGEHYVVEIRDIDREVDGDVVAEFCNFALANTAIRRKSPHA
ncbi:MAG: HxsD-like protein [Deltaproteobacteria bacterium]|nr:HxsD-like protein [Deltaproteobacteria bacterium]